MTRSAAILRMVCFGALLLAPALAFGAGLDGGLHSDPIPSGQSLGHALEGAVMATDEEQVSTTVRLIVLLSIMSILPGILMLMTPFTRFIIVLSLLRQAMGLQQSPPNQVLIALSLMMSVVVMQPTLTEFNDKALQPYLNSEINTTTFYTEGIRPIRKFMFRNVGRDELATSIRISRLEKPASLDDVPTPVVVTAYVLSEVKAAFVTAIKVYIPFLVIDLVVASSLLGMGMMMLPPAMISLPFKLLVFVLMDGWDLLIVGLTSSVK